MYLFPTAAQQVSLEMTMNIPYTSDLADSSSQAFRTLAQTVSTKIYAYLSSSTSGLLSVTVSSFRPGSVVATVNANFQQNASVSSSGVVSSLKQAVANDTENPLGLNTSSISLCPVGGCGVGVTTVAPDNATAEQVVNTTASAPDVTVHTAQQVSLEMTMNIPYTSDLADSNSQAFRTLAQTVSNKIFVYLSSSTSGLLSVTVSSFRPGSVVATVNANFQQNASVSSSGVVSSLKQAVANDTENPLGLNTSSISLCPVGGCSVGVTTAAPSNATTKPVTMPPSAFNATTRSNVMASGNSTTMSMNGTTPAQQVSLEMTMNIPYTSDLANSNSQAFRTLAQTVSTKIFVYLSSSTSGLLSVTVSSFRPGSVVATVNANFQQNASVSSSGVVNSLKQAVANDTENPLGLNTSSIVL
ncbi:Hypp5690 [Branchiostoma lanceolatum]|uniref:Hypp5690 protein n=1 Tax=Branchiostoma lanceolatum TaxID=7740 RepID=A0A8J9YM19_BRALA|nr:Hypp5690 [Branchiostoma lanceolatum]